MHSHKGTFINMHAYICAHMQIYINTRTHTYTHIHTYTLPLACTRTGTNIHIHMCKEIYARKQTCAHWHKRIYTKSLSPNVYSHKKIRQTVTHKYVHTFTHIANIRACSCVLTSTHTQSQLKKNSNYITSHVYT